ncbi:hypothetical protein ASD76_05805 [Altererythrobacter sp. Root672]|nr:hypothetical protein ASD76_05805 [Altererythrobacter sp. Root672]
MDEDPQDSPFSAVQPRHILCILGATHDLQPLRDVVTAVSKAGEYAEGFNIDGDYSQEEPDDRMVASFDICRDRVEPGAWTEADAQAVADHQSVLYVLSPPMTQDNSVAFSMAALMLIDDLLDAGAVAIKAESAGAAHGVQRWRDLVAEAAAAVASDDQLEQRRIARLAFAKRPLSSEAYFESVGFHLVGLPDVHVAQLAGDEWQAIAIMDSIADEIAAQGLAASLESRGARLTRDMNHEEDSFKFNPYGIVKYGA